MPPPEPVGCGSGKRGRDGVQILRMVLREEGEVEVGVWTVSYLLIRMLRRMRPLRSEM